MVTNEDWNDDRTFCVCLYEFSCFLIFTAYQKTGGGDKKNKRCVTCYAGIQARVVFCYFRVGIMVIENGIKNV